MIDICSMSGDVLVRVDAPTLSGAYLGDADLGDADLRGADLGGADLGGAYLGGAYLGGANLRGACITGVQKHALLAALGVIVQDEAMPPDAGEAAQPAREREA